MMTTFDPHAERPWSSEEDKQLRKAVCQGMHAISFSHPSYFIFRFFSPIRFPRVEGGERHDTNSGRLAAIG